MKAIEAKAKITEDGVLTVHIHDDDLTPGEYRVVVVIDEQRHAADDQDVKQEVSPDESLELGFPVIQVDFWPPDLSLRREDMYDEWGR